MTRCELLLCGLLLASIASCSDSAADQGAGAAPAAPPASPVIATAAASVQPSRDRAPQPSATDWPRFRNADGSGVATGGVPTEWSATNNLLWKTPLPGPGSSSPIVFGDRVYVTCYSGYGLSVKSPGSMAELKRHLVCVGRDDGKIRWTQTLASDQDVAPFKDEIAIGRHGYATATPAADASGVYVFYGSGGVVAYSHAGKQIWRASCGTRFHEWGTASSPLIYEDLLIIHADVESHALIALDKRTGKEKWRLANEKGPSTWSTPIIASASGRDELIFSNGNGKVAGVDPDRGTLLWECQTHVGLINASPVACEGAVVVFGSYSGKAAAVRMGGRDDVAATHKLWEINKGAYISSPVYHDGHLYFTRDGRVVYCVNAKTGETVYQDRIESHDIAASPVIAGGKLYYVSTIAGTFVLDAKPQFRQIAHNILVGDDSVFNGTPAVTGNRLLLRSNRFLYCIAARED
ncbi:MAG: PQQ-binding-like beta-propeller repeat protein [Phycisphaeraceae bacterium]